MFYDFVSLRWKRQDKRTREAHRCFLDGLAALESFSELFFMLPLLQLLM